MPRLLLALSATLLAACAAPPGDLPAPDEPATGEAREASTIDVHRDHVTGDIYHYTFTLRVGPTANAQLRIHRVVREILPGWPRPTAHAVMLLHGDFATFVTNFLPTAGSPASPAPGLAPYLAAQDLDVWGVDRRWTLPGTDGDISDLGDMGVVQELGDIDRALDFAEATRLVTDAAPGRLTLAGFSHGAELAYAFAAVDGGRPPALRKIAALVPIDMYYDLAPADADLRANACANASAERDLLAEGVTDSDNSFFIAVGQLDRSAPGAASPELDGFTNRGAMLFTVGLTYEFAPYTPLYHLIAPRLDADGNVTSLRETSEPAVSAWFAGAPPHQSMREAADLDGLWCGQPPLAVTAPLSNIHVPVFYLGAAGAFGDHGLYTTTQLGTSDVTTLVVHRFGAARQAEDFGHGDLLYATDAPTLAWSPLAAWLLHH